MIKVSFHGPVLEKTNLPFESQAVLNPTCIRENGITHMFYRATRIGNFSTIGYCQINKEKVIARSSEPVLIPEYDYEKHGVEDPRIVKIEGLYYLLYTAYDGKNARTALATSTDLVHFKKQGLITPSVTYKRAQELFSNSALPEKYNWYARHYMEAVAPDVLLWEKDLVLFPEKIHNKFFLLHRVMPGVQYLYLNNLDELKLEEFWEEQLRQLHAHILMNPKFWYETRKIAASSTPIKTDRGWLQIYHGVEDTPQGNVYRASVALLDLNDPTKVIGRLPEPLLSPTKEWEKVGVTGNIVFPSGPVVYEDELYIYYGAADTCIAAASVNIPELLQELINNP